MIEGRSRALYSSQFDQEKLEIVYHSRAQSGQRSPKHSGHDFFTFHAQGISWTECTAAYHWKKNGLHSIITPVKICGWKAASRGSRLRMVIWIRGFLLVLYFSTHRHTWKECTIKACVNWDLYGALSSTGLVLLTYLLNIFMGPFNCKRAYSGRVKGLQLTIIVIVD